MERVIIISFIVALSANFSVAAHSREQSAISQHGGGNSSSHAAPERPPGFVRGDLSISPQTPDRSPETNMWFRPSAPPESLNHGAASVIGGAERNNNLENPNSGR